jgi:hypothetical protein
MQDLSVDFLQQLFPSQLTEYFDISDYQILCNIELKEEYWIIDFVEKNIIPVDFNESEYESKGFMESKLIQDFPLRGKPVFLRIKKRRWRHKNTKEVIKRDFSFIADGSKFTKELSDFLKETSRYTSRHNK